MGGADACRGFGHDGPRCALQITAAAADPALLDLPWSSPLEDWPADRLAALPRGISRHVVRFVRMSGRVLAVKEIDEELAVREYGLLRMLRRLDLPTVEPVGVVTGRVAPTAPRWTRRCSPGTCSSRCRTGRCSRSR